MSGPTFEPRGIAKPAWWEWVVRFVFGGLITVATGLVGHHFGPAIGGMCLAFPAILPASLTLVKRHDGRADAIDDARGARLGAFGLVAFASTIVVTAPWPAPLAIALATVAWTITTIALWFAVHSRE